MQAAAADFDSAIHDLDDVALGRHEITVNRQRSVQQVAERHIGRSGWDGGYPRQVFRCLAVKYDRIEPVPLAVVTLDDGARAPDLEIALDTAQVDGRIAQCRRRWWS